ncbi:hypothetical protein JCM5296_000100 [Sporobolomyces johnsonii]
MADSLYAAVPTLSSQPAPPRSRLNRWATFRPAELLKPFHARLPSSISSIPGFSALYDPPATSISSTPESPFSSATLPPPASPSPSHDVSVSSSKPSSLSHTSESAHSLLPSDPEKDPFSDSPTAPAKPLWSRAIRAFVVFALLLGVGLGAGLVIKAATKALADEPRGTSTSSPFPSSLSTSSDARSTAASSTPSTTTSSDLGQTSSATNVPTSTAVAALSATTSAAANEMQTNVLWAVTQTTI